MSKYVWNTLDNVKQVMNKEIIITKYHSFNFEYRVANCNG